MEIFLAFILSYIFGALPVLPLLAKMKGISIREDLHHALWKRGGILFGLLAIIWDVGKGVVPPLICLKSGLGFYPASLSLIGVVLGQMYPVFTKFIGEKGNSTALGAAGALVPPAFGISFIPLLFSAIFRFLTSVKLYGFKRGMKFEDESKVMPLGMLILFSLLPVVSFLLGYPMIVVLSLTALLFILIFKRIHEGLLEDIREGKESIKRIIINRVLYDRSYVED